MGDFEEVERLQAGIRTWLLRTARSGRHELRGISAPAVLPLLCAAAFGPALADADGPAPGLARMGVLVSVGADVLARLLEGASSRVRSAPADAPDLTRSLEAEISRSVREVLDAGGSPAGELRSDIAMVMREIDAGGTACRAAIEVGDEALEREVLAALESLGAEFGDMAFMLSDLARAAGEIQDSLSGQDAELRAARERAVRQAADVRMIREELAVIEQRAGQWQPEPAEPSTPVPRWSDGCPYRGLLPYDQAHAAVFCGRERLTAELTATQKQTGTALAAQGSARVSALDFGPGAGLLATGDATGTITLWNPAGFHQSSAPVVAGRPESPAGADGHAPAAISARGEIIAVSGQRGTIRLRNARTGRTVGQPIAAHHAVTGLAFSPGGKTFATVGANGTAALWSVTTGHRVGALMNVGAAVSAGRAAAAAFSPDGRILATVGGDGAARSWDVAFPAGLLTGACAIADQSLTRQQWAGYAGTQPFQRVCPAS